MWFFTSKIQNNFSNQRVVNEQSTSCNPNTHIMFNQFTIESGRMVKPVLISDPVRVCVLLAMSLEVTLPPLLPTSISSACPFPLSHPLTSSSHSPQMCVCVHAFERMGQIRKDSKSMRSGHRDSACMRGYDPRHVRQMLRPEWSLT